MRGKPRLTKLTDREGNIKSPYWYITYYNGKRSERISTGCAIGSQDNEAQIALAHFILERERPIAREPSNLMIAQALDDYYNEHAKYIATAKHAKYHEARLKGFFGMQFVSHITQGKINEYVRDRQSAGESNGTIRRDLEHLSAAINHEVREQRLIYAPKFKKPPAPLPREKTLSEEEKTGLIEQCKQTPHLYYFVRIMLETGQRPSAVENLKWVHVNFDKRIIRFDLTSKHQNKMARPVPMSNELYAMLESMYGEKTTEWVLEYKGKHCGNVKKSFARACKDAGIEASRYTLRHTFGTEKYLQGHSDKDISDIMGHTTAKTTAKHYIKTDMDRLRLVVNSAQIVRK